jgi:hypothetical protein
MQAQLSQKDDFRIVNLSFQERMLSRGRKIYYRAESRTSSLANSGFSGASDRSCLETAQ